MEVEESNVNVISKTVNPDVPEEIEPHMFSSVQVWRLLDYDRHFRNLNATGDLIVMSPETCSWKGSSTQRYPLPTLVMSGTKNRLSSPCFDAKRFAELLARKYAPELVGIDWCNLVLAGGMVGWIIHDETLSAAALEDQPDIDLFIYGLTEDKANAKVRQIVEHLLSRTNQLTNAELRRVNIRRTQNVLTLEFFDDGGPGKKSRHNVRKYQIIFRLYNTIPEVLHGFDLESSCVGFDGIEIVTTSKGKFAQEYGCNIVDPTQRSPSYEKRLYKYSKRGYNIILPYFSMKTFEKENVNLRCIRFPHFGAYLATSELSCNSTIVNTNRIPIAAMSVSSRSEASGYEEDGSPFTSGSMFYWNLQALKSNDFNKLAYMLEDLPVTLLTSSKVMSFPWEQFEQRVKKFYEKNLPSMIWDGKMFSVDSVKKYLMQPSNAVGYELFKRDDPDEQNTYIEKTAKVNGDRIITKVKKAKRTYDRGPDWLKNNPAGQFNHMQTTAVDYYGEYMISDSEFEQLSS
jgi:hypothetical protein